MQDAQAADEGRGVVRVRSLPNKTPANRLRTSPLGARISCTNSTSRRTGTFINHHQLNLQCTIYHLRESEEGIQLSQGIDSQYRDPLLSI